MIHETKIRDLPDVDVDLSGGCDHLRECADEMGMDYETCHTDRRLSNVNGIEIESYYDENGSVYSPWNAFAYGFGSRSGDCREDAIANLMKMIERSKKVAS